METGCEHGVRQNSGDAPGTQARLARMCWKRGWQTSTASAIAACIIASARAMAIGLPATAGPSAAMTALACLFQSTIMSA